VSVNSAFRHKSTFARLLASASRLALPPTCCLCDAPGSRDLRGAPLDLCDICRAGLPANPVAGGSEPPFDLVLAPFLYAYPLDRMIRALKFRGERVYARVLGQLLAAARLQTGGPLPEALVPIPLHTARHRDRGFNQAEEIAKYAGSALGVPVDVGTLVRPVATREQSGLSLPERRANVRGAFALRRTSSRASVALVDDVLTTASTLTEAARVLAVAGMARIEAWTPARVVLVHRSSDAPDRQ
jgi:ComF family protein